MIAAPGQVCRITSADGRDNVDAAYPPGCKAFQQEENRALSLPVTIHKVYRPGRGICPVHPMGMQEYEELA